MSQTEFQSDHAKFENLAAVQKTSNQYLWILAIISLIAILIPFFRFTVRNELASLFFEVLIGSLWIFMLTHNFRKTKTGQLLMDIGRNAFAKAVYKISGSLLLITTLWYCYGFFYFQSRLPLHGLTIVFLFSLACLNFFLARNCSLELYENGVFFYSNYIPWYQIKTVEWTHHPGLYLKAIRHTPLPFLQVIFNWPVSPSSKDAIDIVLHKTFKKLNQNGKQE